MDAANFPEAFRNQLNVSGRLLHEQLGAEEVRGVVRQVLFGSNVRTATEKLTRRRILRLGLGLAAMTLGNPGTIQDADTRIRGRYEALTKPRVPSDDKKILEWSLGLTKKQFSNVLRGNQEETEGYLEELARDLLEISSVAEESLGPIDEFLGLGNDSPVKSWFQFLEFMLAIGAESLATRGSEKSLYGKYFEKLVLGTALYACGFSFSSVETLQPGSFWLSTRGDKRESDATAMWEDNRIARFDIGFIGQGNSEISLDKVSRFERDTEILGQRAYAKTIIIVDSLGAGSRAFELAKNIEGVLIQMRDPRWVAQLADSLSETFASFESPFAGLTDVEYSEYLSDRCNDAPIDAFLQYADVG